jgi:hypothetical protein
MNTRFRSLAMVTHKRTSVIAALATPAVLVLVLGGFGADQPAAAQGSPAHPAALSPGPGRIQISFAAPRGEASRHGKAVWQSTAIRRYVAAVNARLTLPVNENMHFRPGDSYDAAPDRGQPLDLGYNDPGENLQLFEYFGVLTPSGKILHPRNRGTGRKILEQAVKQFEPAIAMHELGHVFTYWWPIPTTSNNEAIADLFSGWVDVKLMHDPKAFLMVANYRLAVATLQQRHLPGIAANNRAQAYQDLARLAIAEPSWRKGIRKFLPNGYLRTNWTGFLGGQWAGLERSLQPIARVPLGG